MGEKELKRAKEHLVGSLFLGLETSEQIAYYYSIQEIMNKPPIPPKELERKVRSVTPEDIRGVARSLFKEQNLNLAVVGPFKNISFKKLLRV